MFPEADAPGSLVSDGPHAARAKGGRRSTRNPVELAPIDAKPAQKSKGKRDGEHDFRFKRSAFPPGRYRVICRVTDPTKLRGDRHPWVLKDDRGLLQSEVGWWVRVPAE